MERLKTSSISNGIARKSFNGKFTAKIDLPIGHCKLLSSFLVEDNSLYNMLSSKSFSYDGAARSDLRGCEITTNWKKLTFGLQNLVRQQDPTYSGP